MAGVSTSLEVAISLLIMSLVLVQCVRAISRMVMTSSVPISRLLSVSPAWSVCELSARNIELGH